jgi:hypothetical protein
MPTLPIVLLAVAASRAAAGSPGGFCDNTMTDIDIDPHTPGMGSIAASTIDKCCTVCSSPEWWSKGCRFYTLSKGRCWFKQTNYSVVKSPGHVSGRAISQAPPPPPPPPWPKHGPVGDWTNVGPWGIGDDFKGQGEAGTLADAASPAGNPNVIYSGGRNNGASSGLLKSVDGGKHWVMKSNGLFDTRIVSMGIVDMDKGDHVYLSVPGKVYETTDGAESWRISAGSEKLGTCTRATLHRTSSLTYLHSLTCSLAH